MLLQVLTLGRLWPDHTVSSAGHGAAGEHPEDKKGEEMPDSHQWGN